MPEFAFYPLFILQNRRRFHAARKQDEQVENIAL
jgi:hypothetical protein